MRDYENPCKLNGPSDVQVIINRRIELSRFALMHCIASSLCFWVWTILRETMDSLTHHSVGQDAAKADGLTPSSHRSSQVPVAMALTSYSKHGAKELIRFLNGSSAVRVGTVCTEDPRMNIIYQNFSPYLYPFTVEYSILVGEWKMEFRCWHKLEVTSHSIFFIPFLFIPSWDTGTVVLVL